MYAQLLEAARNACPPEITDDSLLAGKVRYAQPARGYRVTVEAPLLARFAVEVLNPPADGLAGQHVEPGTNPIDDSWSTTCTRHIVDLASGPGAIALMLLASGWAHTATAVEFDPLHAALAAENAARNGLRLRVIHGSVRDVHCPEPAELVLINPPYFDPDAGALAPQTRRADARALTQATLTDFLRLASRTVSPSGSVVLAFPAARFAETLEALRQCGLSARYVRFVHPRLEGEAQVAFIAATTRPASASFGPPLCVRGEGSEYSREVAAALEGQWPTPLTPPPGFVIDDRRCCHC